MTPHPANTPASGGDELREVRSLWSVANELRYQMACCQNGEKLVSRRQLQQWEASIAAALAAQPPKPDGGVVPAGGWRPISTAPKDLPAVDLWFQSWIELPEGGKRPSVGFRLTDAIWFDGEWTDDAGNRFNHLDGFRGGAVTHWMMPPPSPSDIAAPPLNTGPEVGGGGEDLAGLSAAATPGPWYVESEPTDGTYGSGEDCSEGYDISLICTEAEQSHGRPGVLFDSHNSSIGMVETESSEDRFSAWDAVSKANAEFIVALVNAYRSGRLTPAASRPVEQGDPVAWAYEYHYRGASTPVISIRRPTDTVYRRNIRPLYAHPAPAASRPAVGADTQARLHLKICPEEGSNEHLCAFPSCTCAYRRLPYPGPGKQSEPVAIAYEDVVRRLYAALPDLTQDEAQCVAEAAFPELLRDGTTIAPAASGSALEREKIAKALYEHDTSEPRFLWPIQNVRMAAKYRSRADAILALMADPRDDTRAGGDQAKGDGR